MIWLPLIALALFAFLMAVFVIKLPRSAWALFGAALLFGLAGYALQGSPGLGGSPKIAQSQSNAGNLALVDARRQMFNPDRAPSRYVTVADGFARRGQFQDAAGILSGAVSQNSNDGEAWLALAFEAAQRFHQILRLRLLQRVWQLVIGIGGGRHGILRQRRYRGGGEECGQHGKKASEHHHCAFASSCIRVATSPALISPMCW